MDEQASSAGVQLKTKTYLHHVLRVMLERSWANARTTNLRRSETLVFSKSEGLKGGLNVFLTLKTSEIKKGQKRTWAKLTSDIELSKAATANPRSGMRQSEAKARNPA